MLTCKFSMDSKVMHCSSMRNNEKWFFSAPSRDKISRVLTVLSSRYNSFISEMRMSGLFRHTRLEIRHNAGLIKKKKKVTHTASGNRKEDRENK